MNTIFTIEREFASGGHEIGRKLAGQLNIPFYDRKIVLGEVKEHDMSQELRKAVAESENGDILKLKHGNAGRLLNPNTEEAIYAELFLLQSQIIKRAAQEGSCIIVGCCADFVLRERENVFSVFIHADQFSRMERAVEEYGMNPEYAAEYLVKRDHQRADYRLQFTDRQWADLENYCLTVDTSYIGPEQAVGHICGAAEKRVVRSIR